jgi:peptide/nickel transport system substrate-binding protein
MAGRSIALAVALGLMAAACTGTPPSPPPSRPPAPSPSVAGTPPPQGGEVTIGAEQWPECLNPVLSCGQPETYQTVLCHVLPRAMQFDAGGAVVPSPLLSEAPTLDNGGLTQSPFTVRYQISGEAGWDDGSPITSEDFAFTWRAILNTPRSVLAEDYRRIVAIDTSDPKSPVLRLDEPWAGWPELFGGEKGFVLKQSAFPDADPAAPNLADDLLFDVPFSGGPFRLAEWKPNQHLPARKQKDGRAVLQRNERYFGPKSFLDRVTFVSALGFAGEMQSFLNGDLDVVNLSASTLETSAVSPFALLDSPSIASAGADSTTSGALWFNAHEKPLDDRLVREALMHAVDRQRLVDELISLNNGRATVLDCGFLALPNVGPWCRTPPFKRFEYNPIQSIDLLKQAGYDCSSKPCRKNGRPLEIGYFSNSSTRLRTPTQDILMDRARAAGFSFKVVSVEAGVLFGAACPWANVAVSGCAVQVPVNGSVTPWFACDQTHPTEPGSSIAMNRIEWCNPEADRLMKEGDRELDPARRADLLDQMYELEASDMIGLPLYVIPTIVAWNETGVAGPIDAYLSSPYGPFFNISEWYRAS